MWKLIRIGLLLLVLAIVAQNAWLASSRTAEWKRSLHVVIYPIRADDAPASARYVSQLRKSAFEPLEDFFRTEAKRYDVALAEPVELFLAPAIASPPPPAPFGGNVFRIILWSLQLRYWAWWHDTYKGARPDVRLFILYHEPVAGSVLPHSTGLQKGMIGVVNAVAASDYEGSNNAVIGHELLHTLGATDKYDPNGGAPIFPGGYADPDANPRLPQRRAEIMAGRIPISATQAEMPASMRQVVIGGATAREINWTK
jgi:hypothetical protein